MDERVALADTKRYEITFKSHPVRSPDVNELVPLFAAHQACQMACHSSSSQYILVISDLPTIKEINSASGPVFDAIASKLLAI